MSFMQEGGKATGPKLRRRRANIYDRLSGGRCLKRLLLYAFGPESCLSKQLLSQWDRLDVES